MCVCPTILRLTSHSFTFLGPCLLLKVNFRRGHQSIDKTDGILAAAVVQRRLTCIFESIMCSNVNESIMDVLVTL